MRSIRVKATFLFHCAFVHRKDSPSVEVLLSAANPNDPLLGTHQMQHLASLRIPEACVANDSELPGLEQITETIDRRVSTDLLWDLRGYDLWIDPPDPDSENDGKGTTVIDEIRDDAGQSWIVANLKEVAGVGIDGRLLEDNDLPDIITKGARVRVWGGVMRCGTPDKELKTRRWIVADREDVGLSDRMEYEKVLAADKPIALTFRPFAGDRAIKTVLLRPNPETGIIRLHVTNDPTPEAVHNLGKDPCSQLPHFLTYSLLLNQRAARPGSKFKMPQPFGADAARTALVLEGDSLCCPCGGAPPEP